MQSQSNTKRRRFVIGLSMSVLSLLSGTDAQDIRFDADEIALWKAAAVELHYRNRELVRPDSLLSHVPVLLRYTEGPEGDRRTILARMIASRYRIYAKNRDVKEKTDNLESSLPAAWNLSMIAATMRGLAGIEPSLMAARQGDIPGGFTDMIDAMRKNMTELNRAQAALYLLDSGAAALIESNYRETLGDKKLPANVRFYIERTMDDIGVRDPGPNGVKRYLPGTLAQIAYAGDQPLKDVLIVTRTTMKLSIVEDLAKRGMIRGFNEAFDNGEGRAEAADKYVQSLDLLKYMPQSTVVYVPQLDPGEVLIMPLYSQGAYYYVKEAKVSVFTNSGAILDRILMKAGPHNDLSIPAQDRPERPRFEADAPEGPVFDPVSSTSRLELTLNRAGTDSPTFEVCVPAGKTYVPIGRRESVANDAPMIAIARNAENFVALGPGRTKGHSLVLVPADQVSKADLIDERTDSEKAFYAAAAAQVARNNARARGEKVPPTFFRKTPQRPASQRSNGLFGNAPSPLPGRNGRPGASMPNAGEPTQAPKSAPKPAKPTGPEYKDFEQIVTITLPVRGKDEEPYRFDGCRNVGNSYESTGRQITPSFDPSKPIRLVAEGPDHYVARVRDSKTKSNTLVLIPKSIGGSVQKQE